MNNIVRAKIDEDDLALLTTAFELYNISKGNNNVYKKGRSTSICKSLISQYYKLVKPDYHSMLQNFRRKYITNESLVESNNSPEERKGIALVYDYIQSFDVDKDQFNIFITSLKIHSMLYQPLDEKNYKGSLERKKQILLEIDEARKNRDLVGYRNAKEALKQLDVSNFGGNLRKGSAVMRDFPVAVPDAEEVVRQFNEYLSPEKTEEFERARDEKDIFHYISYCVRTTADLIALQPFADGNKRTFRSLLNLMFKLRNLPPVYIVRKERKAYHDALQKAICDKDYTDLVVFYYFKICDSIYKLDFEPYLKALDEQEKEKPRQMVYGELFS